MVGITSEEKNKVKRMERAEDSLRDLWDHIKCTNIQIIGIPEEEKKKWYEKIFEEIIVENFPNKEKEIANQVQEPQRVPCMINPRRNTPVLVTQSGLTLCDPMNCSPPGTSVHEILQVRMLEWVAISFSRGSSPPGDQT